MEAPADFTLRFPVDQLSEELAQPLVEQLLKHIPEAARRARYGEYVNDEQAQEMTGLSQRHLRYLREQRRVPYRKCGRTVLYKTDELFALIDAGSVPARDPIPA